MTCKKLLFLFITAHCLAGAQTYPASNFTLISRLDPETGFNQDGEKYSSCWGWYQSAKNKEYAIACSQSGTYWVDVTNPATPSVSAYQAGALSGAVWRETKTYQNYCYVISDDAGSNTLQIFDMQNLPASVTKVYDSQTLFSRGHTLRVDGNKLYVAAVTHSNSTFNNMSVFSLANPASPVLLRNLDQDFSAISYVHDVYVRNDTVYASCGYQGLCVFKFNSVTNTFSQLGSLSSYTAAGYNHSSALTPDGKTLVFTDEVPAGLPFKVAKVSNLANIQVLATANQYSLGTPHNPFIVNNKYCFMSSYMDGLQLFDISNPASPVLAGYFDTYPQGGGNNNNWAPGNYEGQWSNYPYFPSKNIFALDQLNGVFMLKTNLYTNSTVKIEESEQGNFELVVFPNPAKSNIEFNLPLGTADSEMQLTISNVMGNLLMNKPVSELTKTGNYYRKADVSEQGAGIYFLKLYSRHNLVATKKIIITD